jgi:hypothetical protein|tara:strand:- start:374 stop:2008 length:1635 start_codon:yes stop_codon:yes gene_type:complete
MKFLLDFIKTLLTRTGKTKGLNNEAKNEIVQMLTEANESVLKGTKKIDDQIEELRKIEEQIFKAEKTSGEATTVVDRPQRMSATMFEGPERSIAFVAERTGLNIDRAKAAVVEKMNEAYPPGSPKRATIDDDDMIKAYLDNNLGLTSDDPITFLEEIEEIGKNIDTDNVVSLFGKQRSKERAKGILASADAPDPADLGFAKKVEDMTPEEVDALKTDQFVDETMEVRKRLQGLDKSQLTDLAGDMAKQVAANDRKIAKLIEAGEFEKARELEKINQKTLSKMSGGLEDLDEMLDLFPFDPDKPKMAEGGRIGFEPGGDVPGKGKLPMTRRGFLGTMAGGIATLLGGKALMPAAKTGITAAKTLSAPGMPKWFPLLVGKIQTKGNLISPAAPNKGEVNAVYKYKDGMTEYKMVEDVNTGRIDIYTTSNEGTQIGFEYEPSMKRYFEDGSSVTDEPSFFVGEFRKGHEGAADLEQYSMGMDEVVSDLSNVEEFATRGTTMQVDDAIEDFVKRTRTEEPGFKLGGLVPPQAGPMSSGMGSLFRQRTA